MTLGRRRSLIVNTLERKHHPHVVNRAIDCSNDEIGAQVPAEGTYFAYESPIHESGEEDVQTLIAIGVDHKRIETRE